ncbi:MAG: CcmD family protein [Dehalococcoidales bacterium]
MEDLGYLFAAFTVVWLALFGYIFILSRRQQRLRRDIDLLKETLKEEAK